MILFQDDLTAHGTGTISGKVPTYAHPEYAANWGGLPPNMETPPELDNKSAVEKWFNTLEPFNNPDARFDSQGLYWVAPNLTQNWDARGRVVVPVRIPNAAAEVGVRVTVGMRLKRPYGGGNNSLMANLLRPYGTGVGGMNVRGDITSLWPYADGTTGVWTTDYGYYKVGAGDLLVPYTFDTTANFVVSFDMTRRTECTFNGTNIGPQGPVSGPEWSASYPTVEGDLNWYLVLTHVYNTSNSTSALGRFTSILVETDWTGEPDPPPPPFWESFQKSYEVP